MIRPSVCCFVNANPSSCMPPAERCTAMRVAPGFLAGADRACGMYRTCKAISESTRCRRLTPRSGLSLLEIVLALALVAIAMGLLSQLVFLGNNAAKQARDLSKAQMIAESVMAEAMIGITTTSGDWELDPTWSYEISFGVGPTPLINSIRVEVLQNIDTRPTSFVLTQWQAIPPEPEEEETEEAAGL